MTSSGSKATATLSGSPALAMRSASSRVWSVITRIVGVSRTAVSPREAGSISVSTVTNLPPSFESIAQVDGHGVDGHERHEEHDDRRRGDLAELGVGTLGPTTMSGAVSPSARARVRIVPVKIPGAA